MYARPRTRPRDFDRLLRHSYGLSTEQEEVVSPPPVQSTTDAGTAVIPQPGVSTRPDGHVEYVVEREPQGPTPPAGTPTETTGAEAAVLPTPPPPPPPAPAVPPATDTPPASQVHPQPVPPAPAALDGPPVQDPTVPPAVPTAPPSTPPPVSAPAEEPAAMRSPLTTDDLAADMQAILGSGRSAETAPPADGSTPVDGGNAGAAPTGRPPGGPPPVEPVRPLPDAPNEQSIFDRIAQSMEYANSFDLGTVDLQGRFDQFDRTAAARAPGPANATTTPVSSHGSASTTGSSTTANGSPNVSAARPSPEGTVVQQAEPTDQDLQSFWARQPTDALGGVPFAGGCAGATAPLTLGPEHSAPMYDTGEHVLASDLYVDQLRAGRGAGVAFSYGQLIAMGDFYATVDDLRNADPAELSRLKALIERSTAYYRGGKRDRSLDVSNRQWNEATGGRYLRLAEDNDAHFSPPSVLGMTAPTSRPDNKSTWERCHGRAIAEMRALVAANPNASSAPYGPLTVNAFGDHFLTDAFAAGHLVNKEVVFDRFRGVFYRSGTSELTAAGTAFLERLAAECWRKPEVRRVFSPLQLVDPVLLVINLNIDTENMFRRLLTGIAEQEPTKVLNLVVKALHDHLNRTGVEVTNEAGDAPWPLKGDGHLVGSDTVPIMRRAVQQSIDNIVGGEILVSRPSPGPLSTAGNEQLLAKVWRHVPRPTAAGRAQVAAAIDTYTDLGSAALLRDAAEVIKDQSPFIAEELDARNILEHE